MLAALECAQLCTLLVCLLSGELARRRLFRTRVDGTATVDPWWRRADTAVALTLGAAILGIGLLAASVITARDEQSTLEQQIAAARRPPVPVASARPASSAPVRVARGPVVPAVVAVAIPQDVDYTRDARIHRDGYPTVFLRIAPEGPIKAALQNGASVRVADITSQDASHRPWTRVLAQGRPGWVISEALQPVDLLSRN